MPNRPLTDQEKTEILEAIKIAKKRIENDLQYIADLENKVQEGQWYYDWGEVNEPSV